ncbi:MAG: polysaccharide biosynthesis/export family protein [Cyanobacteria bacterium J06607_13]
MSASSRFLFLLSAVRSPVRSTASARSLIGALCLAGTVSIATPALSQASPSQTSPSQASSSQAIAPAEDPIEAQSPETSDISPEERALEQPFSIADALAQSADTPEASESAPTLPTLTPPTEAAPTAPTDAPALEAAPAFDAPDASANQIPTLPPPTGPRFEQPLIEPNTSVAPVLQPSFENYHLGPGDSIFVSTQRYPDLSFQATLDLQGNVIVPIQGAVNLEGLSLREAEGLLRAIYNQYVVIQENRDVAITLVARRGVEVTILGAVQRPGFYPLADPSVSTALLTAGGATQTSDLRSIQVQRQLRRNGGIVEETVNVDLFTPLKEGNSLPDVRLEDGDVLIVPELQPDQLDDYDSFLVARSTLAQPIINVRFLNYAGGRGGVGTLNLNNGSSFIDAITVLGVNPDNANLGDVGLIRFDPETGRAVTVSLDAKSAILGDITQNPPLQDSDVIVVGRNLIGRLSFALETVTRPFRDVFGFTRFLDDAFNDSLF